MKYFMHMAFAASLLVLTADASAQEAPKHAGNQYLTVGLAFSPGIVSDSTAEQEPWKSASPAFGTMVSVGLQHFLAESFVMAAEVELGNQWLSYHTFNFEGQAEPETAFAWQFAVIGRWLPLEELSVGAGIDFFRASLDDAPFQQLGFAFRLGTYLWRDLDFALIEAGYTIPFIGGLALPNEINADERPEVAEQNGDWHRFRLSLTWGF